MKRKMLISITLIIVMLLSSILPVFQVYAASNVVITLSSKLYNAVKTNLIAQGVYAEYNDAQCQLYIDESLLSTIKELHLSNYEIDDLTGLEVFNSLDWIDLSSNELDENSNLDVLNNFNLNYLDLSSNKIKDVSMITDINNIETLNLHNQELTVVNVIEVSDSSTTVYPLPQILKFAGNLKTEWLIEEKSSDGSPYINWSSFYPNRNEVPLLTGNSNSPKLGMDTLRINITDSSNILYDTNVNIFYIAISSNQRGIVFKDKNLYNTVKSQLTRGQIENEIIKVFTDEKDLYDAAYDEPMVLVIHEDDLVNKITNLELNNKQISDLTGIEYFVGLNKDIDTSENYIDSIDKIIELKERKETEESSLQQRFKSQLSKVKPIKDEMDGYRKTIEEKQKELDSKNEEIGKLQNEKNTLIDEKTDLEAQKTQLETDKSNLETQKAEKVEQQSNTQDSGTISALQNEIDDLTAQINAKQQEINLKQQEINAKQQAIEAKQHAIEEKGSSNAEIQAAINEAQVKFDSKKTNLITEMAELYRIYRKEYKLTTILTKELKLMTSTEYNTLTLEKARQLYTAQLTRMGEIEPNLTEYEIRYFKRKYNIPFEETVIENGESVVKEIENPIKTFFDKKINNINNMDLTSLKNEIVSIRQREIYLTAINYCYLERLYNNISDCCGDNYFDVLRDDIKYENISESIIDVVDRTYDFTGETYENLICEGQVNLNNDTDFEILFDIAGKFVSASDDEINAYVVLPKIRNINMNENLLKNIDRISEIPELVELYVADNEINNIKNVNWSDMLNLKKLDVSMNDITNIKSLENVKNIEELYASRNLISGAFNLNLRAISKLKKLDLSYNQIDDIYYLVEQLTFLARAKNISISEYLQREFKDIRLYNQELTMTADIVRTSSLDNLKKVELPMIFRQVEEIDYSRTSFGIDSLYGNVTSDGKEAILDARNLGDNQAIVTITNGSDGYGIACGTNCSIIYNVANQATISRVKIISEKNALDLGEIINLEAEIVGNNNPDTSVIWEVSGNNSENTTISEEGKLTIGNDETAESIIVSATSRYDFTKKGTKTFTIKLPKITSVSIDAGTGEAIVGKKLQLTATVEGENNPDKSITWSVSGNRSTNTKVLPSNNLYVGTNETATQVTVTATSNFDPSKKATVTITIIPAPTVSRVIITPETANVNRGKSTQLTATVEGENNPENTVTWSLTGNNNENTKITENGKVTIGSEETATEVTVTATSTVDNTKSASAVINIPTVTGVRVTATKNEVEIGKTLQLTATVEGIHEPSTEVNWYVSRAKSVDTKISETGLLTVGENETAETLLIAARAKLDLDKRGTIEITVKPTSKVTSVIVTPTSANVEVGNTLQLTSRVEGTNNPDTSVTWKVEGNKSTDTRVSETGLLTIGANEIARTILVTATSNSDTSKKATATITILAQGEPSNTPVVTGISLTPETATVEKGQQVTLTANVVGRNNPDKTVTWSIAGNNSSNTRIDNNGKLTIGTDESSREIIVIATSNANVAVEARARITVLESRIDITLGYQIEDDYILNVAAKTPINEFKNKLTTDCTVVVMEQSNGSNREVTLGYAKTGMLVKLMDANGSQLADKNGNLLVFEVVVKGDVNKDGVVDSLDSNLIKAYRNEVISLEGSALRAADVNGDKVVDQKDSKLVLYHRAEVSGYDLNFKK